MRLLWHGQVRAIRAYAAFGKPLVTTALLARSELRMKVMAGGAVEIEQLPYYLATYPSDHAGAMEKAPPARRFCPTVARRMVVIC